MSAQPKAAPNATRLAKAALAEPLRLIDFVDQRRVGAVVHQFAAGTPNIERDVERSSLGQPVGLEQPLALRHLRQRLALRGDRRVEIERVDQVARVRTRARQTLKQ